MARGATNEAEPAAKVGAHELDYWGAAGHIGHRTWQVATCSCGWGSALYLDKGNARRDWEEHAREAVTAG